VFVTRDRVLELLRQGLSRREVADRLGLSKATVSYHARRLGEPIDERFARRYDWRAIQAYYDEGHTPAECRERFGCSIPAWQDARRRGALTVRPAAAPLAEWLATDRSVVRYHLKRRLFAAGLPQPDRELRGAQRAGAAWRIPGPWGGDTRGRDVASR